MDYFYAAFLGIVQGLTEFLPISSTAHLVLLGRFLNLSKETFGLSFDASLHLGTILALIIYFRIDIFVLLQNFIKVLKQKSVHTQDERLPFIILIATIPGAILGVLLESKIEDLFSSPFLIAISLILFSFVLLFIDRAGKKHKNISQMDYLDGILIGFAQAIALIPGVSRSGITLATGIYRGFTREAAIRFTFFLSIPIILGAGGKTLLSTLFHGQLFHEWPFFLIGIVFSFISGFFTIKFLLKYLQNHNLTVFIVYRILLGILVLILFLHN
jgi:undecaprenyl-diphosphatase